MRNKYLLYEATCKQDKRVFKFYVTTDKRIEVWLDYFKFESCSLNYLDTLIRCYQRLGYFLEGETYD